MNILLQAIAILGVVVGSAAAFTNLHSARHQQQQSVSSSAWGNTATTNRKLFGIHREQSKSIQSLSFCPNRVQILHNNAATTSATSLYASSPVNIIIAGAPASGKGTQCEIIKEKFGVVHLSTGDMLRAAVAAGSDVGKLAKDYMDSGKLVPDEVIIGVVKDRLEQDDCKSQGWLLDGFPRTQAQAKALEEVGVSADCFLFLDVPDEVLVERVVGRRTDPETGKIYHMTFSPPDDEEILNRLEQRSDDTEEKVKVRLEQFYTNVDAVKDSYTDIMVTIDGNKAPSDVSSTVVETIEKMTATKA